VVLTRFIVTATLIVEGIGALIMAPTFIRDFGWGRGIWYAVFHSVSAFCNAGIDLMGVKEPYSSLTSYVADPAINIAVMGLVILGGLGFLAWDDMRSHGLRIKKYSMQTKVILTVTAFLLIVPSIYFFFAEFSHMPLGERIWASLFQAMTPRTAGFNTADLTAISEPGQMLMILLMLIGGAPGSTAGGMKTTTFAVLIACAISVFRKRDSAQFYGRRIGHDVIATAATLAFMYIGLSVGAAVALSMIEGLPILTCLFETGSAIATVGLTLGVTPTLSFASKVILIVLMYIGRVGGLTLIYAATKEKKQMGRLPLDKITVG
jgi:trk system potassium uptake protein TrkH